MTQKSDIKAAALWYAKNGFRVFPVKPGEKIPLGSAVPHGCLDATTDAAQITEWWAKFPDANVGIACGDGLLVVDIDPRQGGDESLSELEDLHGKMPDTATVLTGGGGGGQHLYFAYSGKLTNKVAFEPGIDIRSDGAYVVAPPSVHPSGARWEWEVSSRIDEIELAPAPEWLIDALSKSALALQSQANGLSLDRSAKVDPDCILGGVPAGKRHAELYAYACRLRTLKLRRSEAVELVAIAASRCKPPYTDETAEKLVDEAWKHTEGQVGDFAAKLAAEATGAPIVTTDNRAVIVDWISRGIRAVAKGLKEHSDGKISGHLTIESTLPGLQKAIRSAQFTFSALRTRKEWATDLHSKLPMPWDSMFEFLCAEVTRYVQQGEPAEVIDLENDLEPDPDDFILYPIIVEDTPTVLFGSPGTGKSYLAQWWTMLALDGSAPEGLGLRVDKQIQTALYLDFEGKIKAFRQRAFAIQRGAGLSGKGLYYRRCSRPLAEDVEQIRATMGEMDPDLIIIDSLAPAAGGELNASGTPISFFNALRSLGQSSLIIGHVPKGAANTAAASIYGSVFFEALTRSAWQIRTDSNEGADEVNIALFHTKVNYGPRERPFGLTILHCSDGSTVFRPGRIDEVANATTAITLKTRVLQMLLQMGTATAPDLAEALDQPQNKVRTILQRLLADDHVARLGVGKGQKWSRVAREAHEWQK